MNIIYYFLLIFVIVCLIVIWFSSIYNRFQSLIIRINEAEANIDSVLRKRFDLLNRSIDIIRANTKEKEVLPIIIKLRSKKLSNFELDRQLYEAINEFTQYDEKYPELKESNTFVKIKVGISESEAEVVAFRRYYNDNITEYNKLRRMFPSCLVAIMHGYKQKPYFDGKNMEDNNIKDMKL